MAKAANLRAQIEAKLANRIPAALSLKIRHSPELFSTGIAGIDALLNGGIPRGAITEISGAASTGKTSFVLSVISELTRSGAACAWVDVHDALSPESAAASGVVLQRLLWLRTRQSATEQQASTHLQRTPLSSSSDRHAIDHCGGSSHPRNEMRGMDSAVSLLFKSEGGLLRDKSIGTPGRSNRPLSEARCAEPLSRVQREEQVAYDRLPARKAEFFLYGPTECAQATARKPDSNKSIKQQRVMSEKPWPRLEKALKATDLLLQTGGFAAIVLDMSDVLPQYTTRIPLATWYRFRLAAEQARTTLILMTQSPCANSCAALALRCERTSSTPWNRNDETSLFESQCYALFKERNRNEGFAPAYKKPSARADWQTETEWARVR